MSIQYRVTDQIWQTCFTKTNNLFFVVINVVDNKLKLDNLSEVKDHIEVVAVVRI
jgi:hypothetical protein